MAELSLEDPSDLSKLMRFIVVLKSRKREVFDELIKRRWGTPMTPPNTQQPKAFEKYEDHEQQERPILEVEDIVDSTGKLINQQPAYDQIINAEVQLQLGEEMVNGKVLQMTIGHMRIIHSSTQSSMMWNFLMAKSKSMQPTSLLKTC